MSEKSFYTVREVWQALDGLAPPALAAEWDTAIGLEAGSPHAQVSKVMIALDVTAEVIAQAHASGCQLIICHHPLIFTPLATLRQDVPEQNLIVSLVQQGISLLAAHTNLDAAPGGVADCLADIFGLEQDSRQPAGPFGRFGLLPQPLSLRSLLQMARERLGSSGCRINTGHDRIISRLAVFPGSFSEEEIPLLTTLGSEAIICGEIKHHVGLMLAARGIVAIDAGHDVTERVVLEPLAARLAELLPEISFAVEQGIDYNKMAF